MSRNREAQHHPPSEHARRGYGTCLAVVGSTTATVFETYVEKVLTPSLGRGQVVVLDDLTTSRARGSKS